MEYDIAKYYNWYFSARGSVYTFFFVENTTLFRLQGGRQILLLTTDILRECKFKFDFNVINHDLPVLWNENKNTLVLFVN